MYSDTSNETDFVDTIRLNVWMEFILPEIYIVQYSFNILAIQLIQLTTL